MRCLALNCDDDHAPHKTFSSRRGAEKGLLMLILKCTSLPPEKKSCAELLLYSVLNAKAISK